MGSNESGIKPNSNPSHPRRPMPTPRRVPAPESVPVWPENSYRWKKLYDVYICSSENDIQYATALLQYLQDQPENLRCFLPMRDMNPGGAIPTEMTESAENSHCWIMLLTSNSISDEWCQFQMHQFLALAPGGNGRLIPVMVALPFQHYPKELRFMFSFKDNGEQNVFPQLRRAIVTYLTQLPTVANDPREETASSTSEGPSSSRHGITSPVMSSPSQKSTSTTSARSPAVHGSSDDASPRSLIKGESTSIVSCCVVSSESQVVNQGTSLKSFLIEEPTSNATKSISTSMTSTSNMSDKRLVNQETTEASQQKHYTKGNATNISGKGSLNQALASNVSVITSITSDRPSTGMQVGKSIVQEFTSETSLRPGSTTPIMDPLLSNSETQISNSNTLTTTLDSHSSTTTDDSGSCKEKEAINMQFQNMQSDVYTRSARTAKNKVSTHLQSDIYTSCGATLMNKDSEVHQGDIYTSSGGTNADMKDSLDLGSDIYTSCGAKAEPPFCSLQSNIYTSFGGTRTEDKDSGHDLVTCSGSQAVIRDTPSLTSNIYYNSEEDIKIQSPQDDRYTSRGKTEANPGDLEVSQEDLYASHSGKQIKTDDSVRYHSDLNTSCGGKQAHMDFPALQTQMYTNAKGNQQERRTSCIFQSDLYTSCRGRQGELTCSQDLQGEKVMTSSAQGLLLDKVMSFGGHQASNKISGGLQSDIYTSSDGRLTMRKEFWAACDKATTQTMDQLQHNLLPGCTGPKENEDSGNSGINLYTSCTGGNASGGDSCLCHSNIYMSCSCTQALTQPTINRHRDASGRPANEAADKT